jgi:PAS domain S-box-containing protein
MPNDLQGEQVAVGLTLPEHPAGYLLLLALFFLLGYVVYIFRGEFGRLKRRQWLVVFGLCIAAALTTLIASPLPLFEPVDPTPLVRPIRTFVTPFGSMAWLFAAATLNPAAALIVGFVAGLTRALSQTQSLFTPISFALLAVTAQILLQRNYVGRVYAALRRPLVNGITLTLGYIPLLALATLAYASTQVTLLSALDIAFTTAGATFLPLLLEGVIAGGTVAFALYTMPTWRPVLSAPILLPWRQQISYTLVRHFILFSIVLTFIAALIGTLRSVTVARELVISQMAQSAEQVTDQVNQFVQLRRDMLVAYSQNERLVNQDTTDDHAVLRQLFDSGDLFTATLLVGSDGTIHSSEPTGLVLTVWEQGVVGQGQVLISPAQASGNPDVPYIISFVVPIVANSTVLVGRINQTEVDELAAAPDAIGQTFITDEAQVIIADPDGGRHTQQWRPTPRGDVDQPQDAAAGGTTYEQWDTVTKARQLVYYRDAGAAGQDWRVVIITPYDRVLQQALPIGLALALILPIPLMAYGYHLVRQGRRIAQPITNLSQVARQISQGSLDTSIPVDQDDEVGHLAQSFEQMRYSLKKRLDELSLLLSVSQNVSTSVDISQSLQTIIASAVQSYRAQGARIIMSNPGGRQPLQFGEGPLAAQMEPYDRTMMRLANQQQSGVLILRSRQQIRATLSAEKPVTGELSLASLIAIPMHARDRYRGVFWLGYTEPHEFSQSEINFLTTLAGQASVVAENTLLFANAEGGRRRLLAVLSSTADAVLVTDQTDRVILVNPAMEKAFGLKGSVVYRRLVRDVLNAPLLLEALLKKTARPQSFELTATDDRVYLANVSAIRGEHNELLGRVAVLRDITAMKEISEMKTELVRTVSHDLRGPLAYMRGYATMLPSVGEINDKQQYYLSKIIIGVDQMTSLVEGILNLRRLEAGIEVMLENVRPEQLLENVASLHETEAEQAGLHLMTDVPTDLPRVPLDRSLMQQALSNLVLNAIKYAKESGPLILSAAANPDELIFSVQDRGPGIPADSLPHLFDEFYRVQQRGSEHIKGAGLGLSLVRSIARRHGGRAWCQSKLGEGSTFYLSVPLNGHGNTQLENSPIA